MKPPNLYPGWKMTPAQHRMYWNLLNQVYAAGGLVTAPEKEKQRKLIHLRAFGREGVSAKEIDRLKMFDAFKAECLSWIKPDDLSAQLRQTNQERHRLIWRIGQFDPEYVNALLASPRFGGRSVDDMENLSIKDLTDLRNTLCARLPDQARRAPVETPF